ncbi:hypothetical protein [Ancylobacter oerskovii]|uniref:Copper-binding protein n=1 Tax=Ancylobacter oerskovii TaxID=459519 RepID=A0ABW4Z295_9HYPH|nr:hypothetical protein [Ancylobacter oerskovii]MBS7544927.1 hypothetical protein [Ancylobacter oerskovii]
MKDGHRRRVGAGLISTVVLGAAALFPAVLLSAGTPAQAGDLAKGRQDLPEIVLGDTNGNDFAVPVKDITMEGGKSYRLNVTSNGGKEYKFMAPEFFRNAWMNQIVINHLEIHPYGPPHHIEFDDAGTIALEFVPIRTGTYEWWIEGLKDKGMHGTLTVK